VNLASLRLLGALACAFAFVFAPVGAANGPSALVQRMAAVNPSLQSYTASLHVVIAFHTLPLSPTLNGSYYFRRPDKQAVVFDSVPILAQQFQKIYPKIDPPATWQDLYDVSMLNSNGGATTLRLTPKRSGRVAHLDVTVDDASAMPSSFTWTYVDGGTVSFDQAYERVGGNYLVRSQNGKVNLPSYNADVTTTFSNFQINVPVPDTVFGT
jgi:outer membrane lipoprotein-sorting protein